MRNFVIPAALVLAIATPAAYAIACEDENRGNAPGDDWLTIVQIAEKYASAGYDIREIEIEDGGYEMEAIDQDGKRVELQVDPVTGETLEKEHDDDDDDDD